MASLNLINEVQKIWKGYNGEQSWQDFTADLEVHKKLLSVFQPGDYYYWLLNSRTGMLEFLSPEAEKVLGYPMEIMDLKFLFSLFHPDDVPYFLNFEAAIGEFIMKLPVEKRAKYKVQYDFRFRKADGNYIRILNQIVVVEYNEKENLFRSLGFQTDISHLKKDIRPVLSLVGLDGEPSYYDIDVKSVFKPSKEILTQKEKEVLRMLTEGKISKEICVLLNISKTTVDSHRKNMLKKTASKSTSELVNKAIMGGWI